MMTLNLIPVVTMDKLLSVHRKGELLYFNETFIDLSVIPEGATLQADGIGSPWISGDIIRTAQGLELFVKLPISPDAPQQARFPKAITNPADGNVHLPGLPTGENPSESAIKIELDLSRLVTKEMKEDKARAEYLAYVIAEASKLRAIADASIAPLQDALDLDEATDVEVMRLRDWKRYRVALNRLPDQEGYPDIFDWPTPPA